MTTMSYKRCTVCGIKYIYQGSGPGCLEQIADSRHCTDCASVIHDALRTIPRRYEHRWRDVKEVPGYDHLTLEQVKSWEEQDTRFIRRIWPALYNLGTGDSQSIRLVYPPKDDPEHGRLHPIRLSTWKKDTDYKMEVEVEWDTQKGEFTGRFWP